MNRKVFCTSAQHPVYFYVSSSSGQLYSLICDIHDNGRYRPNAARSTYPGKKNRVGQKSPQVYHRKPYHLFGSGVVICNFPLFQYEAGSYPLSGMATVSIHREQVMISGAQPQQIIADNCSKGSLCRHKIPNRTPLTSYEKQ